jgi:hypothetical protein
MRDAIWTAVSGPPMCPRASFVSLLQHAPGAPPESVGLRIALHQAQSSFDDAGCELDCGEWAPHVLARELCVSTAACARSSTGECWVKNSAASGPGLV